MEREVGGGIGMGNTCKPMAVLFQCMTKFTTKKKKKTQLQDHKGELISSCDPVSQREEAVLHGEGLQESGNGLCPGKA